MFPTSTLTIFIVQGAFHSTKNHGLNSDEKRMEQHFPERPKRRKTSGGISKFLKKMAVRNCLVSIGIEIPCVFRNPVLTLKRIKMSIFLETKNIYLQSCLSKPPEHVIELIILLLSCLNIWR